MTQGKLDMDVRYERMEARSPILPLLDSNYSVPKCISSKRFAGKEFNDRSTPLVKSL